MRLLKPKPDAGIELACWDVEYAVDSVLGLLPCLVESLSMGLLKLKFAVESRRSCSASGRLQP